MSTTIPVRNADGIACSLFNLANAPVDILILGAGRGGMAILEVLQRYSWINIRAVVDIDPEAGALQAAREAGIPVSSDIEGEVKGFGSGIIIDVTGDRTLPEKLKTMTQHQSVELVSGKSARLLYDLIHTNLRNQETIRSQETRLGLLDSMLDITLLLEQRPPLSEVTHKSFQGLYSHVRAVRGVALMLDSDTSATLIGAIGVQKSSLDVNACRLIHSLCCGMSEDERFVTLAQPLDLDHTEEESGFNIIVPVRRGYDLAGALLFHVPGILSQEQRAALNMASVHLEMTVKTLHHFQQLETMAIIDGLTCMFNRRYFDQKLREEIHRIKRRGFGTLTCAFIDVDNFKSINDRFGHQVGDRVLRRVAESISHCTRDYDISARYGGDEFILLLPSEERDEQEYIEQLGLRLLEQLSEIRIPKAEGLKVTASIGMATQSAETLNEEMLLNMADAALYQAKRAGKCCLRVYSDKQFHLGEQGLKHALD